MENLLYRFKPTEYFEVLIIESWRYLGFEKALYMDSYHLSYNKNETPLKGPRGSHGYSVYNSDNILFGLVEYYFEKDGVHLGLGINPKYIGRGLSTAFILESLKNLKELNPEINSVYLEVDRRNIQGIKAYEKAGFRYLKKVDNEIHYIFNYK